MDEVEDKWKREEVEGSAEKVRITYIKKHIILLLDEMSFWILNDSEAETSEADTMFVWWNNNLRLIKIKHFFKYLLT